MLLIGHLNVFRFFGDVVHLLSVFIILFKMLRHRTCAGLSMKSQVAYALVFSARYGPSLLFLQFSTWYLLAMKLFFLLSSWYIVFLMRFRNPWRASYSRDLDSIKMRYLVLPSAILAILCHYQMEDWWGTFSEVLWTFSQYLEAVAIMPQLLVLTKQMDRGEQWEIMNGHYVASLGLYRFLYVCNWVYRWYFEARHSWVDTTAGVIQTLLFADFFVTYAKGIMQLGKEALPGGK
eukprot:Hpha_TRINITY_DN31299_c0_g1::TRINITY_DN31299_c0_g1_i1::g.2482::m.2482/K10949/KDELR; ER lumen protein retaining receptor